MFKKFVIVGAGGTGSFLLPIIMRFLNSRQDSEIEVVICDGDKYDEGNVNRQEFAHSKIGMNKAEVQSEMFRRKFPNLSIFCVPEYLGKENINSVITDGATVFCCVDNHFCRHLISEHCQKLKDVLLISGGNEEFDGNVQAYYRRENKNLNDPIEVRHPEIGRANDGDRSEMSCEQLSQLPSGGQVIFTNATSANIMCNLFYGYLNGTANIEKVNDIFFDIRLAKTVRIVNGTLE